jgi:hypothetical protein
VGADGSGLGTLTLGSGIGLELATPQDTSFGLPIADIILNGSGIDASPSRMGDATLTIGQDTTVFGGGAIAVSTRNGTQSTLQNFGVIGVSGPSKFLDLICSGSVSGLGQLTQTGKVVNADTLLVTHGASAAMSFAFEDGYGSFENTGLVAVGSGATLNVGVGTSNKGTIYIGAGATVSVAYLSSVGRIEDVGGTLAVGGSFTNAGLRGLDLHRGYLVFAGTLNNAGAILSVGTSGKPVVNGLSLCGATITGGTVIAGTPITIEQPPPSEFSTGAALSSLSDVRFHGSLNITNSTLAVNDGTTLAGLSAAAGPTIAIGGTATLNLENNEFLNNAVINENGTQPDSNQSSGINVMGGTDGFSLLLLGPKTQVTLSGSYDVLQAEGAGNSVINQGTITSLAASDGGTLQILAQDLTNQGLMNLQGSVTLLDVGTNTGTINAGTSLDFGYTAGQPQVFTNNGHVLDTTTGGTLTFDGGFSNAGTLRVDNGAGLDFSNPLITITNTGIISATATTLTVMQAIAGTGTLLIGAAGTLDLRAADHSQIVSFTGASGLLEIAPTVFTGSIGAFQAGDMIDLENTVASAAAFNGNSVVVTLSAGGTLALHTQSPLNGALTVSPDQHGGTIIAYVPTHT